MSLGRESPSSQPTLQGEGTSILEERVMEGGGPASHREGFVAALPVPLAVPVSHHAASALPMMGRGGKGWEGGVAGKVVLGCVG